MMVVVVSDRERGVGVVVGSDGEQWGGNDYINISPSGRREPHHPHREPSIQMQAPPRDSWLVTPFLPCEEPLARNSHDAQGGRNPWIYTGHWISSRIAGACSLPGEGWKPSEGRGTEQFGSASRRGHFALSDLSFIKILYPCVQTEE